MMRYSSRSIHQSVANELTDQLGAIGWTSEGQTPFGAPKLRITTHTPRPHQTDQASISAGAVVITLGDNIDADPQEMGGPLSMIEYPIFVDIYMDKDAHALAVAQDVTDIFAGRVPGTSRFLPVIDLTTGYAAPGWLIELTDIERTRPVHDLKVHWQVVKVTASTYFPEVAYS